MEKLSEVTKDMFDTAQTQTGTTSSTAQHGSIARGGKASGQPNQQSSVTTKEQSKHLALLKDPEGQKSLSTLLLTCFNSLPTYGKEPEQLEDMNGLFKFMLSDYSYSDIRIAFKTYLKSNRELPAPSDIINIIERGGKPPFERSVYIALTKKKTQTPENLTSAEWAYMREYEQYSITGDY